MKSVPILFIASLLLFKVVAQDKPGTSQKGEISGKVVSSGTDEPIEYATVTVYSQGNTKPINGIISNAKGNFKVDGLPKGYYSMTIEFLGFSMTKKDSLQITDAKPSISIGTIKLAKTQETLQTVTVTAKQPIVENKIDKIVYNADRDITSQGGVATDVLKKVPQVFVDVDGNVELQGSSSIRFLINGKPSTIFGSSVNDALQAIPASQIQSIEVITSPGAKYDAQGTGGIINIILKKSTIKGMNGSINLSAGTRLENGSVNLNYRHNNFGVNAFFSGNAQLQATTYNSLNRISNDTASRRKTNLMQDGNSSFQRNGFQTGLGFDWSLSKKDNITGSVSYNHFLNKDRGLTNLETNITDLNGSSISDIKSLRQSQNNFTAHAIDWSLNYKKSFKKDRQELDIMYNSSYGLNNSFYSQNQYYPSSQLPFSGSNSNNPGSDNETNISIDYAHPISDNFLIETGVKNVQNSITSEASVYSLASDAKTYALDNNQSYALTYKRSVYAYYLSTSFSLFKFLDVKAGARYEYTTSNANFSNVQKVDIPSYHIVVPSFTLSHSISENQSLKISYSRRIERPEYRELNPFVNLSDPHNITTGNPALRPEIGNNYELGYSYTFDKGSNIYVALGFRKNTDNITSFTTFYPTYKVGDSLLTNVSLTTRQNINAEERFGVNVSGTVVATNKLTLRSNIFAFDQRVVDKVNATSRSGFGYRMNLNGTYLFNKDLAFEVFGNFRSKETTVQGSQTSFISYNAALRKFFLNKKLSIGLSATNLFGKTVNQRRETFGSNFQQVSLREIPFRSFGINLMYKFGKLEFKKSRDDEQVGGQNAPF